MRLPRISQKVIAMFADPQDVTIAGTEVELPRVSFGDRRGTFKSTADGVKLSIVHNEGKRNSSTVRLDYNIVAADPLLDGVSRPQSMSAFFTINTPQTGFSTVDVAENVQGLLTWLAGAGNLSKVINGES